MRGLAGNTIINKITAGLLIFIIAVVSSLGGLQGNVNKVQAKITYEKETVYYGEGFTVKYTIDSQWGNQYTANVVLTNTGDKPIENWELSYESYDEYSNIWNAKVSFRSARIYNIKNAGHNQNIEPKQSISFGFQASFNKTIDIPKSYKLLGETAEIDDSECQVTYNIQSQWNNGSIINITLHNNSDEDIENWSMKFDLNSKIDNIWRAKIESHEGSTYTVKNCGYNSVIAPDASETIGMQVSFEDGGTPGSIENIVVSQSKKGKTYVEFDKEWNRTMVRADSPVVVEASKKNAYSIKIGLIDSGVDYSSNINIVERENFVEEYIETNPIFDDLSGHGTAVAGLMASDSSVESDDFQFDDKNLNKLMNEKIQGVNPYINIYSARVLDDNNETTVSRLIAALEWAIEKDVDIININCGISKDNKQLYDVIKKAYNKGILIIAAAGNDKSIQYPAKYSEVMAVGSVKCTGEQSSASATGEELEVVAPGQDVTSYGPFGILDSYSGSSMAAPQVTALAAILWQQDLTKSNEFIRQLIDVSANNLGSKEKFGYGMIDCENALQKYNEFEKYYSDKKTVVENVDYNLQNAIIEYNDADIICTEEESVKGYWSGKKHETTAGSLKAVQKGAIWPDTKESKIEGMTSNPTFHGYYQNESGEEANYIEAYIFMTKVAANMYKNGSNKSTMDKDEIWLLTSKEGNIDIKFAENIKKAAEAGFKKYNYKTKKDKANFIYGMALHTVADIFAHSTYAIKGTSKDRKSMLDKEIKDLVSDWKRLTHGPKDDKGKFDPKKNFADMIDCIPMRYNKSAKKVCNEILNTAITNHKVGTKNVFKKVEYYRDKKYSNAWGYINISKEKNETEEEYQKKIKLLKKNYIVYSYGIINFNTYMGAKENTELGKLAMQVDAKEIKDLLESWISKEAGK